MSREKECQFCGVTFHKDPRNTWAYWERAKYCSSSCAGKANTARAEAERPSLRAVFEQCFIPADGDCWPWIGNTDKDGYGVLRYAGKSYRAAPLALRLDGRPVPPGLYACHHCDNPLCVNPSHLYPGTPKQNMQDAKRRGRLNAGRRAKVNEDDVRAIRAATGTHEVIAASFGISRAAVSLIRSRKTWGHVE